MIFMDQGHVTLALSLHCQGHAATAAPRSRPLSTEYYLFCPTAQPMQGIVSRDGPSARSSHPCSSLPTHLVPCSCSTLSPLSASLPPNEREHARDTPPPLRRVGDRPKGVSHTSEACWYLLAVRLHVRRRSRPSRYILRCRMRSACSAPPPEKVPTPEGLSPQVFGPRTFPGSPGCIKKSSRPSTETGFRSSTKSKYVPGLPIALGPVFVGRSSVVQQVGVRHIRD